MQGESQETNMPFSEKQRNGAHDWLREVGGRHTYCVQEPFIEQITPLALIGKVLGLYFVLGQLSLLWQVRKCPHEISKRIS